MKVVVGFKFTVYNHVTCRQWAYRMLQRILMENQYIFDVFKVSDRYCFVFSVYMRNEISKKKKKKKKKKTPKNKRKAKNEKRKAKSEKQTNFTLLKTTNV